MLEKVSYMGTCLDKPDEIIVKAVKSNICDTKV